MARGRRNLAPAAAAGPKERHRRAQRPQYDHRAPVPPGFVAKLPVPKSKHHTYFEFVKNKEKKKKLEFQVTTRKTPPPGFEFVPIGNPQLTTACKELSREMDAMIFIVSNARESDRNQIVHQVHRIGHHIREAIVEEAKAGIVNLPHHVVTTSDGEPEPIPASPRVYHAQVDAAIRDLFPRIPNTDRQMIIEHAFTRGSANKPERPVGLCDHITLARRVQLAALAHIRHTHTRYDVLLKETSWQNARRVVEALCLDILVKWRGDEENGRDQLDEILREVVVISDSEDSDEESTDDTSVEDAGDVREVPMLDYRPTQGSDQLGMERRRSPNLVFRANNPSTPIRSNRGVVKQTNRDRTAEKRAQRGFKRYRAWEEAIRRNRGDMPLPQHFSLEMDVAHSPYQSHKTPMAPNDMLGRPSNDSDLRVRSTVPGSVPGLNGYVSQQNPAPQPSWDSSFNAGQNTLIHHPNEKVMSVVYGQSTGTSASRYPPSPVTGRFQDMLLPSIEPASPDARPSFVRALPPRSSDQMDSHLPRSSMQHRPGPALHEGERISLEKHTYLGQGASGSRSSQQDPRLGAFLSEGSGQLSTSRDVNPSHSINRGMPIASPLSSTTYIQEPNPYSALPQTRRIVVNARRPGGRSHPILMEDRGGFYEKVNVQAMENQPPTRGPRFAPQEERPMILKESRGAAGVELIPVIDPFPNLPLASYFQRRNNRCAGGQPQQGHRESLSYSSRPVPRAEYGAPPPEGYWVIQRRDDRPTAPQQLREPVYRQYRSERPPVADEHYDSRREYRPRPKTPPNVIVLD